VIQDLLLLSHELSMPHTPLSRISSPSGVPTGKQRFLRRRTHVIKKEMGVEVNKMRVQSGRHNGCKRT
ncbi:hypothetical protein GOODEAATRI_034646, partial [Goodea atripinnis]